MMRQIRNSGKARRRPAFTLIELLVVVAIIALLISILLPSLARARELSKRAVCAANLKGVGTGFYTFDNENDGQWPAYDIGASPGGAGLADREYVGVGATAGGGYNAAVREITRLTTTSCLYTLVREGMSTPKSFWCPSSSDKPLEVEDPLWVNPAAATPVARTDFSQGIDNCSYGYQVPFGSFGIPSSARDARMGMAADKGPWSYYAEFSITGAPALGTIAPDASPDEWRRFNSPNHGGLLDGEGQNVLYTDSHVEFMNKACSGVANDNLYTRWNSDADPARHLGTIPSSTNKRLAPFGNTDCLIYP